MIKKELYIKMYITILLISIAILLVSTNIFGLGVAFDISIPTKHGGIGVVNLPSLVGLLLLSTVLMAYILMLRKASQVSDIKETLDNATNAYDYLSIFVWAIIIVYLLFILVAFPVTVTQNSMTPTILDSEKLIVKTGHNNLKREDVVVFKIDSTQLHVSPEYDDELWLKRVIGLPGETIEFKDGVLYVNGEAYVEEYLYDSEGNFKKGAINGKGYDCMMDTSYRQCKTLEDVLALTGLKGHVIPEGYYLLLGDNRANSFDSWSIGLVPENLIIGKAKYVMTTLFEYRKVE